MRNLKEALNHGFVLKNVHRVIRLNPNAWLKTFIDKNTLNLSQQEEEYYKNFGENLLLSSFQ